MGNGNGYLLGIWGGKLGIGVPQLAESKITIFFIDADRLKYIKLH
jgi:hypothetical protein